MPCNSNMAIGMPHAMTRKPSMKWLFLTGVWVVLAHLSRTCSGCSPPPGWEPATPRAQWLAAAWVVEGTTQSVTECSSGAPAAPLGVDEAPAVGSPVASPGPAPGGTTTCDFGHWVQAKDIVTKKGPDLGCAYIEITPFVGSSLCGIDPPSDYSAVNTYFLCSLEVTDEQAKICRAVMNTEGNLHVGMVSGVVDPVADEDTAPSTCPQRGTCQSVDDCEAVTTSDKCCQDLRLLKFKYNRDKAVCAAASKRIDTGGCKKRTWVEARELCESEGYRLCTHDELVAKEAAGAGCQTKKMPAWTSTPCKGRHYMTATTGTLKSDSPIKSRCKRSNRKAKVVCCADQCDS